MEYVLAWPKRISGARSVNAPGPYFRCPAGRRIPALFQPSRQEAGQPRAAWKTGKVPDNWKTGKSG